MKRLAQAGEAKRDGGAMFLGVAKIVRGVRV